MKRPIFKASLAPALFVAALLGACATTSTDFTAEDVATFQPPITVRQAPERPLKGSYSLYNNTTRVGLAQVLPQVPSFDGKGELLASWNPHLMGARNRPTFIVVHGGHGLGPTNFASALWLRETFEANVLVLDSYWSRGREENWATWTPFGVNMRALDAIAAARWLRDTKGTDAKRTFLVGDSQGGWTVLRTFTTEPFWQEDVQSLFGGGIALYPNCKSQGTKFVPRLGPFSMPVVIFTGGKDTATPVSDCNTDTLKSSWRWVHYPDQTHGWDVSNRGAHTPSVDGECGNAMNTYNHFPVCRSDKTTNDMRRNIQDFVRAVARP